MSISHFVCKAILVRHTLAFFYFPVLLGSFDPSFIEGQAERS